VTEIVVHAGSRRRLTARCGRGERLVAATHAIGFPAPPTAGDVRSVDVTQRIVAGATRVTIAAGTRALVQIDLVCGTR
jgi:hypothetical protein